MVQENKKTRGYHRGGERHTERDKGRIRDTMTQAFRPTKNN